MRTPVSVRPAAGGGNVNTFSAPARPSSAAPAPSAELRQGHDEAWWGKEHQEQVARIEQLEKQVAECPEVPRFPNPTSGNLDRRASDRARSDLKLLQTQLENVEENARRQDVPPGWLR